MNAYMTEQRKSLFTFFKENADKQFSAQEIFNKLESRGISLSAVYRNLASLEKNGYIRRTIKEGSRECFYQYLNPTECSSHIHMECQECGDTFHVSDSVTAILRDTVLSANGFAIDNPKTILYGNCKNCNNSHYV